MSATIGISYVEREQANAETITFYDKAEDRFEMLLNIFKVFGHTPELGGVFTDTVMERSKPSLGPDSCWYTLRATFVGNHRESSGECRPKEGLLRSIAHQAEAMIA